MTLDELSQTIYRMPISDILAKGPVLLSAHDYLTACDAITTIAKDGVYEVVCAKAADGTVGPLFRGVVIAPRDDYLFAKKRPS